MTEDEKREAGRMTLALQLIESDKLLRELQVVTKRVELAADRVIEIYKERGISA